MEDETSALLSPCACPSSSAAWLWLRICAAETAQAGGVAAESRKSVMVVSAGRSARVRGWSAQRAGSAWLPFKTV